MIVSSTPTTAAVIDHRRPPKEVLCYQCALRMSMLFNYPPPSTIGQVQQLSPTHLSQVDAAVLPVMDDEHHPLFTLVYETQSSVRRYFDSAINATSPLAESVEKSATATASAIATEAAPGSTAYGMLAGDAAPRYAVTWLCTACMGLYQFMDLIHAPLAAAEVRASPYYDATAITLNVNVNRSFTFTWLAVATRYFDVRGTGTDGPPPNSIVKEELSNFKDFYMSDLRARILPYLLHLHNDVVASAETPAVISRSTSLPGIAVYMEAMRQQLRGATDLSQKSHGTDQLMESEEAREADVPPSKRARADVEGGRVASVSASPLLHALQAFRYSGLNESVIGEVYCRHHATEGLITEGHLPASFCGNRSTEVLPFSVIYDYAVPYLLQTGWMQKCGSMEESPEDRRVQPRTAATVAVQLQHASIFLMGNYRKMMRNMSQSPWFLNGQRIGSYSLQEVIANPVLPFFFPDMPAVPPDAQLEGGSVSVTAARGGVDAVDSAAVGPDGKEIAATGGASKMQRGAHSSRWQAVAPSTTSTAHVFGYNRYKFHSAGREDVDVRMLGEGRPFVLELTSPIRESFSAEDLHRLQSAINDSYAGSVEVSKLRVTDADITVRLARHSESKVKRYRCVVWCSRAIEDASADTAVQAIHAMKDLTIAQRTPLRVLHRRSLHPRQRTIHSMRLTQLNAHWFLLDLETQAGTYVKEFVHGDMGRTTPHLGILLKARTDILQLDVVGMAMHDLDPE